jgi:hypothetical protein
VGHRGSLAGDRGGRLREVESDCCYLATGYSGIAL